MAEGTRDVSSGAWHDLPADRFVSPGRRLHLKLWSVTEAAREVGFARSEDGWHLALTRYGAQRTRRHPVLLVHGLGSNRLAFDLAPEVSLAAYLGRLGFDVFALDLRGHGRSEKPRWLGRKAWGWSFHHYPKHDLPAAIDAVLDRTGAPAVHVVGHSMGGIALHIVRARNEAARAKIRSGVTLGAACDYSETPTAFHWLSRLAFLTYLMPAVPLGPLASQLAPVALAFDNPIDRFNVHASNVEVRLYRRLLGVAFHAISPPVLRTLGRAFRPGGLLDADDDGDRDVDEDAVAKTPLFAIAGTEDKQCAPEAAARLATDTRTFGRAHGHEDDYGHFDLIMGRHAADEVWPTLADWLTSHD